MAEDNKDNKGPENTKGPENKQEEFVQIKKEDLNNILNRLEKLTKDQDLLFKSADKNRLAKVLSDGNTVLIHTAKVSTWDDTGKFVLGWKLTTNKCEIVNGRWIEEQVVSIVLDDGKEVKDIPLLEFYRKTIRKVSGEVVSKSKQWDKVKKCEEEELTIQFEDGKQVKINSNFIN